jgi:hypothetical protein
MHLGGFWLAGPLLAASALAAATPDTHQNSARQTTKYAPKQPPLTTPWTDLVGTDPWPDYPRPQLQRSKWKNLNGIWQYQDAGSLNAVQNPPFGQALANEVLVPSCLESGLSGMYPGVTNLNMWTDRDLVCRYTREGDVLFMVSHELHRSTIMDEPKRAPELWRRGL